MSKECGMVGKGPVGCALGGRTQQTLFLLQPNRRASASLPSEKQIWFFVYRQQMRSHKNRLKLGWGVLRSSVGWELRTMRTKPFAGEVTHPTAHAVFKPSSYLFLHVI